MTDRVDFMVQIVSSRKYAQRAVLKFATHTGANYMGGKWVPGTLTNQFTKRYVIYNLLDNQSLTRLICGIIDSWSQDL